jgi:uncharacterized membrane protein
VVPPRIASTLRQVEDFFRLLLVSHAFREGAAPPGPRNEREYIPAEGERLGGFQLSLSPQARQVTRLAGRQIVSGMIESLWQHTQHHARFYLAIVVGVLVWVVSGNVAEPLRTVLAGDALFLVYLASMVQLGFGLTPKRLRQRADIEDEGMPLIVGITLAAIALSIRAIFALLNKESESLALGIGLGAASVILGWLMFHVAMAFHYAHGYYSERKTGLAFPSTAEPVLTDFLYFSFVIGMTAQVSDVQVLTASLRRTVLLHGILSFFYNTVLLALAVNVTVNLAS